MLLKTDIINRIRDGLVKIAPFKSDHLGTNSYDVTLGEFFYREQPPLTRSPVYNIYDPASVGRVWGTVKTAVALHKLVKDKVLPFDLKNINLDDRIVLLAPGETILAHTEEFIGGINGELTAITTKMHCRSGIGRSLLGVCKCAGLGDVGYINRWTMEITSFSQYYYIPLVVGRRIAQIEFNEGHSLPVDGTYTNLSQKYQQATAMDEVMASWKPHMMLPRLDKDRELCIVP